jgi:hypothetical protein
VRTAFPLADSDHRGRACLRDLRAGLSAQPELTDALALPRPALPGARRGGALELALAPLSATDDARDVTLTAFERLVLSRPAPDRQTIADAAVKVLFRLADADGDGSVTKDEVHARVLCVRVRRVCESVYECAHVRLRASQSRAAIASACGFAHMLSRFFRTSKERPDDPTRSRY